ncbi:hypothetical protein GN958_ATG03440 [Phytophthora infestans]|uniref:Uncharacterized protein n=1 Tax=Phytophthora infestans TaxID=4787 RepID=A0A8S9V3G0_PHYIN|nr:hypothetical protein GN958_ATG17799 [Phytophthora infestans]KAF4147371.1 hypothetical protein GN958_ATG03440 [Phytophthora infestans]
MKDVVIEYVSTKEHLADLLTKAVTVDVLSSLRGQLEVRDVTGDVDAQKLGKRSWKLMNELKPKRQHPVLLDELGWAGLEMESDGTRSSRTSWGWAGL